VGRWAEIFEFLAGKDVDGDQMDLSVTVLSGLRGGHIDDLAGTVLDHNEAVLAESRALHRIGGRGASIGALEGVLMLSNMLLACIVELQFGSDMGVMRARALAPKV
jgi:hypothetical protein